jgi:hypothetical protein
VLEQVHGRVLVGSGKVLRGELTKNPSLRLGLLAKNFARRKTKLLDLGFFEEDVLAHDRIILAELELVGGVLLVLGGGVEETSTGGGDQFDFVAFFFLSHDLAPRN